MQGESSQLGFGIIFIQLLMVIDDKTFLQCLLNIYMSVLCCQWSRCFVIL